MAFDNIRLEKSMYREAGKSFTQVLESLDASENYRGTPLEHTDAFQRQLSRFGIACKGPRSSQVEKFFSTFQSAVLFPEYVARCVRQGMEENDILPAICATTTMIDAMDYRAIYSVPTEDEKSLKSVGEGAQIQTQHVADAVDVLMNGDGNSNAATAYAVGTSPIGGTSGTLTYDELVEFWAQFNPYEMNTMIAPTSGFLALLKLDELQNPLTGLNFQGTGKLENPLGAQLLRSDALASGKILGLDRRYALEMVCAGEVSVEFDKLIDRQLERAAISSISGFAKICDNACASLTI